MNGLKIFVSSHKPCYEVKNEIFVPARQSEIVHELLQGDAEDVFMAERANEYCELLTQYYAWKRVDAQYYGFAHYRRYFDFSARGKACPLIRREYLNARTAAEFCLTDGQKVRTAAENADVVAPVPLNYYVKSVYWQYCNGEFLHAEDLDAVLGILEKEYPEYLPAAKKYLSGHYLYTCNMFVMKRELFLSYSEWLFGILKKFYAVRDMAGYSAAERRAPGHLGERLFGIWLTHLKEQGGYKMAQLPIVLFENTSPRTVLTPAFEDGVPVFLRADGDGAALAAVTLSSLLSHANAGRRYDIIAFGERFTGEDKEKFLRMTEGRKNVSLRFLDVRAFLDEADALSLSREEREVLTAVSIPLQTSGFDGALVLEHRVLLLADAAEIWDAHCGRSVQCADGVFVLRFADLGAFGTGWDSRAAKKAAEFLSDLPQYLVVQDKGSLAVRFTSAKVPWKGDACPYAEEFWAEAKKTAYAGQMRSCDKKGRFKERKTLFDRVFPQGTRRRSAVKKLFRR